MSGFRHGLAPFGIRLLRAANTTPGPTLQEARARAILFPPSQHVLIHENGRRAVVAADAPTTKE